MPDNTLQLSYYFQSETELLIFEMWEKLGETKKGKSTKNDHHYHFLIGRVHCVF